MAGVLASRDWSRALPDRRWREYILRARQRFERQEAATVEEVREVYRRTARELRTEIERLTPGTLRERHLRVLAESLEQRAKELNDRLLRAIYAGVYASVREAVDGAAQIGQEVMGGLYEPPQITRLFAAVNERAVVAVLGRTLRDGLKLSDRVWEASREVRDAVRLIVEDAVATGQNARDVARMVDLFVRPGAKTVLRPETRRRLRVPSDVSHQAIRLAVTELNVAFQEGTVLAGRASPSYLGILWRLSNSHPVVDVCDYLATWNGGFWPRGNEPVRPHPWCRCVVLPVHEDIDSFVRRLRAWLRNPQSDPQLEAWFNGVREFLPRPTAADVARAAASVVRTSQTATTAETRRRVSAWTELAREGDVPEDVVDQALDELVSATEAEYFKPTLGRVPVEVKRVEVRQEGRSLVADVEASIDRGGFKVKGWKLNKRRAKNVDQVVEELRSAQDLLTFTKALRKLCFMQQGARKDLPQRWYATAYRLKLYTPVKVEQELKDRLVEKTKSTINALDFKDKKRLVLHSALNDDERRVTNEALEKAEDWLRRVLRGPLEKSVEPPRGIFVSPEGRSYYLPGDNRIIQLFVRPAGERVYSADQLAAVMVHEFGHHLDMGPWGRVSRRLTSRFHRRRILGDAEEWRLAAREWGHWDQFFDYYVGRVYGTDYGLEVLTVGMEWLYHDPLMAVLMDPEHASLTIGIIKGVGAP